jgi:indolepyruvate ferredoxin oxidoreductase, alpha subunit
MRDVLREALTTDYAGPKVIVASSECMLNKQRREKPCRAGDQGGPPGRGAALRRGRGRLHRRPRLHPAVGLPVAVAEDGWTIRCATIRWPASTSPASAAATAARWRMPPSSARASTAPTWCTTLEGGRRWLAAFRRAWIGWLQARRAARRLDFGGPA